MNIAFDGRVPPGTKRSSPIYDYINSDINRPFGIEDFENMNKKDFINKFLIVLLIFIFIIFVLCYL
jgi:hypothetical protein